jgi:hypothetical protein
MTGRIIAMGIVLCLMPLAMASADDIPGEPVVIPKKAAAPPAEVVTAPIPASVSMTSKSIGAGVGVSWGEGTLSADGERHAFEIKGLGLGDLGYASSESFGDVRNLENVEDLAGTYVAVQAAAATGSGVGRVAMRNENGVVITLRSESQGAQLKVGADAMRIELK